MTVQQPTKSVSEIIERIAEALDNHLGSPAWRGNASVKLDGARITFTDNAGAETQLDLSGLVPQARPDVLTALGFDANDRELLYRDEDGQLTRLDLSSLGSDVHISGGSYDPETMRLTLKDTSDETPDVIIDFSGLVVHMETDEEGRIWLKDGRGPIGQIDMRRKIEVLEHRTGELWVDGRPVVRAIFDVSGAADGTVLSEGVAVIVRQYGACCESGGTELPAPQDHDGNTFQVIRSAAGNVATFRRAGNFAHPRAGEWVAIEFVKANP